MKDIVDLTENRDFRKQVSLGGLKSFLGVRKLPWEQGYLSTNDNNETVFSGDKEDRRRKREWKEYEHGLKCERCGFDYTNKPWCGNWSMCFKCDSEMDLEMIIEKDLVMNYPKHVR